MSDEREDEAAYLVVRHAVKPMVEEAERLRARAEAAEKRLAAIATAMNDGSRAPERLLKQIEAIAKGDPQT